MRENQPIKQLQGKIFGRLHVIKQRGKDNYNHITWLCKCECGEKVIVVGYSLKSGATKSCGCLLKENGKYSITHGLSKHPLMPVWSNIIDRCSNKKSKNYLDYGGRGVKICDEWLTDFKAFYDWCMANGWVKGMHVDKDINGNGLLYSPETCCIVTAKVNGRKKRNTLMVTYKRETKPLTEWCEILGIDYKNTHQRIKKYNRSLDFCVKNRPVFRRVKNTITGKIYESMAEAAKANNTTHKALLHKFSRKSISISHLVRVL
jgi:hypothetical protein